MPTTELVCGRRHALGAAVGGAATLLTRVQIRAPFDDEIISPKTT
jgi:hypothetical protein